MVRKRGGRKRARGRRRRGGSPGPQFALVVRLRGGHAGERTAIPHPHALVDDFTRERLTLVVDTSLTGLRVARELDRIAELRGYPGMVVSDNGTELTSNAILAWRRERDVDGTTLRPANRMREWLRGELQRPTA